jgi:hypothetical protein
MDHYRSIPFPYAEIETPAFEIHERWNRDDFFGFVRTWSAYKKLLEAGRPDPLIALAERLDVSGVWSTAQTLDVRFDLHMRVGRAGER